MVREKFNCSYLSARLKLIFEIGGKFTNFNAANLPGWESERERKRTMPRNAKRRRSSKDHGKRGLSEASKKKLDTIGEEAEEETLEGLLSDFDIQSKLSSNSFSVNNVY